MANRLSNLETLSKAFEVCCSCYWSNFSFSSTLCIEIFSYLSIYGDCFWLPSIPSLLGEALPAPICRIVVLKWTISKYSFWRDYVGLAFCVANDRETPMNCTLDRLDVRKNIDNVAQWKLRKKIYALILINWWTISCEVCETLAKMYSHRWM